ncbi:MAG TPA: glutaredoxin domain-containing protein [Thermoanaerobaculaceae bacterium]|nr:glutaredoxin domain-containing protein [Thermoanaerobaculaceae bacterium]
MSVLVYVADGCPHCRALVADLARRRVEFSVVNLSEHPKRVAELAVVTWERRLPVAVDHERCSVGFRGRSTPFADLGLPDPSAPLR